MEDDRFVVHKSRFDGRKIIVLPEFWTRVVTPWDSIHVQIKSESASSTSTELEDLEEPSNEPGETPPSVNAPSKAMYESKVRYRIDLYRASRFLSEPPAKIGSHSS